LEKGRKAVGGKIEILLKIREPFENKDTEIVNEKWLILDSHLRGLDMVRLIANNENNKNSLFNCVNCQVLFSESRVFTCVILTFRKLFFGD